MDSSSYKAVFEYNITKYASFVATKDWLFQFNATNATLVNTSLIVRQPGTFSNLLLCKYQVTGFLNFAIAKYQVPGRGETSKYQVGQVPGFFFGRKKLDSW